MHILLNLSLSEKQTLWILVLLGSFTRLYLVMGDGLESARGGWLEFKGVDRQDRLIRSAP